MEAIPRHQSPHVLADGTDRRDALRSLGAAGMTVLTALGWSGAVAAAKGTDRPHGRKKRGPRTTHLGRRKEDHETPLPSPAGPDEEAPSASAAEGRDAVAAEKKKPKRGPTGPTGPAGPAGVSGWERVQAVSAFDENSPKQVFALCTGSKRVLGGGYLVDGFGNPAEITVVENRPSGSDAWIVKAYEVDDANVGDWSITAYAICANVGA